MLVVSRKENQRIRIGDNIVVTVIRIGNNQVKIGILAPADVKVLRNELAEGNPPCEDRAKALKANIK